MKVTLKIDLGDHKKGDVLDIKDETVLKAWQENGVIEKSKTSETEKTKSK